MSLTQYLESQEDQDMTRLLYFTRTQERRREGGFLSRKRRVRRGIVSLTQYLESQEDQDMTRLLNFTNSREEKRGGFFCVLWNEGEGGFI